MRLPIIFLLLSCLCGFGFNPDAQGRDKNFDELIGNMKLKFIYGAGCGGTMQFYSSSYRLYLSGEGFLAEDSPKEFGAHVNGDFDVFAGLSVRNKLETSFHSGYAGYGKNIRMLMTGVEAKMLLQSEEKKSRMFLYLDGYCGIPLKTHDRNALSSGIGFGFRNRLGGKLGVDYSCGLVCSHTHPHSFTDKYSTGIVGQSAIRSSNTTTYGLRFRTALIF